MENMKFEDINELTHKIIGCAMQVHGEMGNGFKELIYQRALAIEMRYAGLEFEREKEMKIYYRGEDIGTRRVDFFVEGSVMVELKLLKNWRMYIRYRQLTTAKPTILQTGY